MQYRIDAKRKWSNRVGYQRNSVPCNTKLIQKQNCRIGLQLLSWFHPLYDRDFWARLQNLEKLQLLPQKTRNRKTPRIGKQQPLKGQRMKPQKMKKKAKSFTGTKTCVGILRMNTSDKQNRKRKSTSRKRISTPNRRSSLWWKGNRRRHFKGSILRSHLHLEIVCF